MTDGKQAQSEALQRDARRAPFFCVLALGALALGAVLAFNDRWGLGAISIYVGLEGGWKALVSLRAHTWPMVDGRVDLSGMMKSETKTWRLIMITNVAARTARYVVPVVVVVALATHHS